MHKIYWFAKARVIGGPMVRTKRMIEEFGECGFFRSEIAVGQSWFSPVSILFFVLASCFKKTIFIQNGFFESKTAVGFLRNRLLYFAASAADVVVFQSEYCKREYFRIFGSMPGRSDVILNSVPSICIDRLASVPVNLPSKYIYITGNLRSPQRRKEFNVFLKAYMCSKFNELSVVILDSDFEGSSVEANVLFLGKVENSVALSVLRNCLFVVHLKENDPCPNAVVESLLLEKKVLHHNSGGTIELVLDSNLRFNRYDIDELISVLNAFDLGEDGEQGKIVASHVDWKVFVERYSEIFNSL